MKRWWLILFLLASCGSSRREYAVRDEAALRGLRFLEGIASDPALFREHGEDLMWAFYSLAEASADPVFKQESRTFGKALAYRWRAAHAAVPEGLGAYPLYRLAAASGTADDFGVIDDGMRQKLAGMAHRFRPEEYLSFDPAREGPPRNIPEACHRCKAENARGAKACHRCGGPLQMISPYDHLFNALIVTYTGARCGIWFGGSFADVAQWIPSLRPYPAPANGRLADDYGVTYTVTHIIYTLNDYSVYRLRPEWLPAEFAFLRTHAKKALDENDPETLGEFLDSLQAFGVPETDPLIAQGIGYLLAHQNADGSWGDPAEADVYTRYHTTWTGIGGVMRYGWRGERVTDPEALRRMRGY